MSTELRSKVLEFYRHWTVVESHMRPFRNATHAVWICFARYSPRGGRGLMGRHMDTSPGALAFTKLEKSLNQHPKRVVYGPNTLNETIYMAQNHGGVRPGAGRKPIYGISERETKRLMKALRDEAREKGVSWQEQFVGHLYSDDRREAAAFFKMLTDRLFVRSSEQDITVNKYDGPGILLPEQLPDPADAFHTTEADSTATH